MKKELAKLELEKFFSLDASEIVDARKKALSIHHSKNIDAAGDEVEIVVRNILSKRFPQSYYVGHGHIVDQSLTVSAQLDVIISDNHNVPILFRTKNDTEYFPYESVYAIGEIKSTYNKSSKYIKKFVESVVNIKTKIYRAPTPASYLAHGINLGEGLDTNDNRPYKNPLMSFMLFVNSGDFDLGQVADLYLKNEDQYLPNIVCLLDKGYC